MIARVWRCVALREKVGDYLDHLQKTVFPELYQIDGYRGACVLRRDLPDSVEITVQTLWESMDAIRKFAGQDITAAVVAPAAQPLFRSYEVTVTHYEIALKHCPG
jgi:heme-degrading monooxygenase HmoA